MMMKTPKVIHPKPPKGWRVTTRRDDDPDIEQYIAYVWNPRGKVSDVVLNGEHGTEFMTRSEAKRAGIQRAHEMYEYQSRQP